MYPSSPLVFTLYFIIFAPVVVPCAVFALSCERNFLA